MTADFSTWLFPHWLDEVDRQVNKITKGDHLADLSPWDGRRAFVAGLEPKAAAFEAALNDTVLGFFLAPGGQK